MEVALKVPTLGGKYIWSDIYLLADWRIQKNIMTGHYRLLDDRNKRRAWGSYDHCLDKIGKYKAELGLAFPDKHIFLLLHGLGRHRNSMLKPEKFLRNKGFSTYSLNYPSTFQTVESHADDIEHLLNSLDGVTSVSIIGHSLGGLIARELLSRKDSWRKKIEAKQLIMLGTPNNGARLADMMSKIGLFHAIAGPSGQDLRPYNIQKLHAPDIPTYIIAGGRGTKTGFNPIFGEDNDGITAVSETIVDDMKDFRLVSVIHTTIMDHPNTLQAILDFIHSEMD